MYLKKITIGNPLYNLGMVEELEHYESVNTDDELALVYHHLLDVAEKKNSDVLRDFVFAMIAYSTNVNINPLMLLI